jgi:branched-chain amino acid transport system substrate-binding protein
MRENGTWINQNLNGKRRSHMKKCFAVLFAFLFLAIGSDGYAQKPAPYVIGFVGDLTGRMSEMGMANKRGMEIAIEAINGAGGVNGREIKAIVYDSESETSKSVLHTKRLIDVDKVTILTCYNLSGSTMASIQTAEDGETVLFSASASEKIWIPTKKWVFNVVPRQWEASIPMLIDVLHQKGVKKIAYIYIDTVYGQTGKDTFDRAVKEMKFTPAIIEKYAPGSTDVGPQMTHIKSAGADGILITGNLADTVMVIKNARDMGFRGPIVSDYAIVGPEFIKLGGVQVEGVVTTSLKALVAPELSDNDAQKKGALELYNQYVKRHGAFSLYAGHMWDEMYLLVEALRKVDPKLEPTKESDLKKIRAQIRDNLEKIKGFVGQNGIFNYSPDNHNGLPPRCYVPVVVDQGKWKLYTGK